MTSSSTPPCISPSTEGIDRYAILELDGRRSKVSVYRSDASGEELVFWPTLPDRPLGDPYAGRYAPADRVNVRPHASRDAEFWRSFGEFLKPRLRFSAGVRSLAQHTESLFDTRPLAPGLLNIRLRRAAVPTVERSLVELLFDPSIGGAPRSLLPEIGGFTPDYFLFATDQARDQTDYRRAQHRRWLSKIGLSEILSKLKQPHESLVAVLDSGVQLDHPDLRANLATADGRVSGIDTTGGGSLDDQLGHGTLCAGVIGADSKNRIGIEGVARNVRLLPIRMLNEHGCGHASWAILAIREAVSRQAHVINASWGGMADDRELRLAIAEATDLLFVTAAGNAPIDLDGAPPERRFYPAAFNLPNMLTVTSLTQKLDWNRNHAFGHKKVHLAAPGEGIFATTTYGTGYTDSEAGTSMAAAFVSGAAALLKSEFDEGPTAIKSRILAGARPVKSRDRFSSTGGYLHLAGALAGPGNRAKKPSL